MVLRGGGHPSFLLTLFSEKSLLKGRAGAGSGGRGDWNRKTRWRPGKRRKEGPGALETRFARRWGRGRGRVLASLWSGS